MNKYRLLQIISATVLLLCVTYLIYTGVQYRQGEESYEQLDAYVQLEETETTTAIVNKSVEEVLAEETTEYKPNLSINYLGLKKINSDFRGWISACNNKVSYPIVIAKDNEKYLHTTFDGKNNFSGCIFMDYRCSSDFKDFQTVIYGHSMKNGTMFRKIIDYDKASYGKTYPNFYIYTEEGLKKYRVFSVVTPNEQNVELCLGDVTEAEKENYINKLLEDSFYDFNVKPIIGDSIASLITCDVRNVKNRVMVSGVLCK